MGISFIEMGVGLIVVIIAVYLIMALKKRKGRGDN